MKVWIRFLWSIMWSQVCMRKIFSLIHCGVFCVHVFHSFWGHFCASSFKAQKGPDIFGFFSSHFKIHSVQDEPALLPAGLPPTRGCLILMSHWPPALFCLPPVLPLSSAPQPQPKHAPQFQGSMFSTRMFSHWEAGGANIGWGAPPPGALIMTSHC